LNNALQTHQKQIPEFFYEISQKEYVTLVIKVHGDDTVCAGTEKTVIWIYESIFFIDF
jgi:hypothetical protein